MSKVEWHLQNGWRLLASTEILQEGDKGFWTSDHNYIWTVVNHAAGKPSNYFSYESHMRRGELTAKGNKRRVSL